MPFVIWFELPLLVISVILDRVVELLVYQPQKILRLSLLKIDRFQYSLCNTPQQSLVGFNTPCVISRRKIFQVLLVL